MRWLRSPAVLGVSWLLNLLLVLGLWDQSMVSLGMFPSPLAPTQSPTRTPSPVASDEEGACPRLSSVWRARIRKTLARVAGRVQYPETLDRGIESFTEKGRVLRFTKVANTTYITYEGNGHFTVRGLVARLQFARIANKFPHLPEFDVVVNTHDWPACFTGFHSAPQSSLVAFSYSSFSSPLDATADGAEPLLGCVDIPFPDFTEYGWPESVRPSALADPTRYLNSTWRADLKRASARRPFAERIPQLLFRGSSQRFAHARTKENLASLRYDVNRTLLDIRFDAAFMSVFDLSRYRYLLHLPGNGYSSRLKYLMYSDALVFRDRRDRWIEWWSQGLVANVHYVLVTSTAHASNRTQWALDNPTAVDAIRARARAYLDELPHPDDYLCNLLEQYARIVQAYTPRRGALDVDLASSLVDPFYPRAPQLPQSNSSDIVQHMRP